MPGKTSVDFKYENRTVWHGWVVFHKKYNHPVMFCNTRDEARYLTKCNEGFYKYKKVVIVEA